MAVISSAAGMALGAARPIIMGQLVANAASREGAKFVHGAVLLAGLVVSSQLVLYFQSMFLGRVALGITRDLRTAIFHRMLRMKTSGLDRTPSARLIMIATSDVQSLLEFLASGGLLIVFDVALALVLLTMMVILDWRSTVAVLSVVSILAVVVAVSAKRSRNLFGEERVRLARLTTEFVEQISGITLIQSLRREARMRAQFEAYSKAWQKTTKDSALTSALVDASVDSASILAIAALVSWVGFSSRFGGGATFATVVTFTSYVYQLFEPFRRLSRATTLIQQSVAGLQRAYSFCTDTPLEEDGMTNAELPAPTTSKQALTFEHVSFGYRPDEAILHDVSFDVAPGEHVAVVGKTGAGKSTLARLALRFYDVTDGAVAVFGRDVRQWPISRLRSNFALVSQDVHLFEGTVASNVDPDPESLDLAKVEAVLQQIGAAPVFAQRGGALSPILEGGSNLSAGERQLIALARAVYLDAPIVLLDEATANLDQVTERRLKVAIDAALVGKTAIVIAHRLETIRTMDRVLVFHGGRLVESGAHSELLAQRGVYAKLVEDDLVASRSLEDAIAS